MTGVGLWTRPGLLSQLDTLITKRINTYRGENSGNVIGTTLHRGSHPEFYRQQSPKLSRVKLSFFQPSTPTGFAQRSFPNSHILRKNPVCLCIYIGRESFVQRSHHLGHVSKSAGFRFSPSRCWYGGSGSDSDTIVHRDARPCVSMERGLALI